MTRNRELSQLGKYILVDDIADEINFVGGTVNATTFIGDGSGLSAITATGTGVEVRDDGSLVGVAATINFGDNLTVSPISAGIVTVTGAAGGGGGGILNVSEDSTPELGGNLNLNNNNVTGSGNINIVGIITATEFDGKLNSSNLLGALPAIDGSALFGIVGTGSGVDIQQSGAPVGTAATINFVGTSVTFSSGIANVSGFGGAVPSRTTVSGSTGTIAPNASANLTILGYKSYALLKAEISSPAWVTLYCDTSSRTADSSRLITEDPAAGSGVIAEVITTTTPQTVLFTPTTIGFNNDGTPSSNIYAKVVNTSGVSTAITVSLTIVQLES